MIGKRKELRFKTLPVILLGLMMMLGLVGCSKSGNDESTEGIKNENPGAAQPSPAPGKGGGGSRSGSSKRIKPPPGGWIKRAYFSAHKNKEGRSLKIKVETVKPIEENQYFTYVYWKNGKKVGERKEDILDASSYKKGDVVFADVLLYQDGQALEKKRSQMALVPNTSPLIKEVNIPDIVGPGTYKITVKTEDIDKDKITFSLLTTPGANSLPAGSQMQIDPATGTITCVLGKEPPPEKLKFIIAANDGDGGVTKKAVTIPFKVYKTPEKAKNIEEKKKETGSETKGKGEPQ